MARSSSPATLPCLLLALEKGADWGWGHRGVLTANVTGLVLGVAMYLGISLMTQIVQLPSGLDESVFVAGFTLLPLSLCSTLPSRALPLMRRRVGPRAIIPVGATVIAGAILYFATTGDALSQAFVTMGHVGLGLGLTFAAMPDLIVGRTPARDEQRDERLPSDPVRWVLDGSGLAVTLLRAFDGGAAAPTASSWAATR